MSRLCSGITLDVYDNWLKIGSSNSNASGSRPTLTTVARSKLGGHDLDPKTGKEAPPFQANSFVPPYKRYSRLDNPNQTAYATYYQKAEEEAVTRMGEMGIGAEATDDDGASMTTNGMERLDVDSVLTMGTSVALPDGMTEDQACQVYNNYNLRHNYDAKLSITKHREEIVDTVESNQVTVIQGETGSGKTTQVAQYILDSYAAQNRYCNIVVTQPRRIAAISISNRVCQERGWQTGRLCGWQVGHEKLMSEDTRLLYCTTGVLLQKLISEKNMHQYTHVILDEVHERDQDSDFCLLVVRKLLRSNSRDVKVILMSATIDCDMFASYFALSIRGMLEQAPVIKVEGRCYAISEYYVEDLKQLGEEPFLDPDKPGIATEAFVLARKLIEHFDRLEEQSRTGDARSSKSRGSVLCFLPGLREIMEMEDNLKTNGLEERSQLVILPLHSAITGESQCKVFDRAPPGYRKIILSTNIAESSITVPDIKYVIDFCLTKNNVCDPETNYTSLQIQWASRGNCKQRKGRAGRVSTGRVYRMITRSFWKEHIPEYCIPEMQRCPLEQLILRVKRLDLGEPKAILGLALAPPNLDDIERTVLLLKEAGALTSLCSGNHNPHDGTLTFLGIVLSQLPLDIHLGKLMMLGHAFGMLEECIVISACLSLRSFFRQPYKGHLEAYRAKLGWANGTSSDCIACLLAYQTWQHKKETGVFPSMKDELGWGRKQFLEIRRLNEVLVLVNELKQRLKSFNIITPRGPSIQTRFKELSAEKELILKIVLCGAFYPSYFVVRLKEEEDAIRELAGKNPHTTVIVRGLPANQGPLYAPNLTSIFQRCDPNLKPRIQFEDTKAYVEFQQDRSLVSATTAKVLPAVYVAIKMRLLRIPMEIQQLDPEAARKKMEKLNELQDLRVSSVQRLRTNRVKAVSDGAAVMVGGQETVKAVALPPPHATFVAINITQVNDCGQFWAHYGDDDTWSKIVNLQRNINMYGGQNLKSFTGMSLQAGLLCLAPYQDEADQKDYYRARIEKLEGKKAHVFFLDYGNAAVVLATDLREMDDHFKGLPSQAFECKLHSLKPSVIKCPNGSWTLEARRHFEQMASQGSLYAEVYSVLFGVLRIKLIQQLPNGPQVDLNQELIRQDYADHAEENLASKQNHLLREEEKLGPPRSRQTLTQAQDELVEMPSDDGDLSLQVSLGSSMRRGARFHLSGPRSPYEMDFASLTCVGHMRNTRVNRDSVNCVAINADPHDKHARMMVGGYVEMNQQGCTVLARDTTLMPNIHGLPGLVSMLFAPTIEIRTDPERKRYIGALCGLGWDPQTGGPALPDHDMEITFDTVINLEDVAMVNLVRCTINMAIGSMEEVAAWGPDATMQLQKSAGDKLLELIKKRRESMEPVDFHPTYGWNQVNPAYLLHPDVNGIPGVDSLYNLHSGVMLDNEDEDEDEDEDDEEDEVAELQGRKELQRKRDHNNWLHHKANRSTITLNIECQLCNVVLPTPCDLMMHLATKQHREQEADIS